MTPGRAAERAVLGALLVEPERFGDVRDWLQESDFDGTAERQTYEAVRALAERDIPLSAEAVDQELRSTPGRASVLADGAFLVECMEACPAPKRAAVYGRMVLEMSIRRRIAAQGTRLRQKAGTALTGDSLTRVFVTVDSARRDVERLHQRESLAAGVKSPTPLRTDDQPPSPRRVSPEDVKVERAAVLALVQRPSALDTVRAWLAVGDFSDVECASLYRELGSMHSAEKPIDAVTVAWRAEQTGIAGPTCDALVRPPDQVLLATGPVEPSRRVLEQSVRRTVLAAAQSLEALAKPAPENATATAYRRLNDLWPQQKRLIRAQLR